MKNFRVSIGLLGLGFALGCGAGVLQTGSVRAERLAGGGSRPGVVGSAAQPENAAAILAKREQPGVVADASVGSRELAELRAVNPRLFDEVQAELGEMLQSRMIERLAESDPSAAALFVAQLPRGFRRDATLLLAHRWSRADPVAALRWYEGQCGVLADDVYREGLGAVLAEYAHHDPSYVFRFTTTHPDPSLRDQLLEQVAQGWATRDARGAIEWLASLTGGGLSPDQMTRSYTAVMRIFLKENPQEAARAIGSLESQTLQVELAPQVAEELAERDWSGAMAWVRTLSNQPARRAAVEALVGQCLPVDPGRAFDLLLSAPELFADSDGFGRQMYFSLALASPAMVRQRFEQIPAGVKPSAVASLSEAWLDQGRAVGELTDWIATLPAGPQFDEGAAVLAQHLAGERPLAAVEWVSRVENAERRAELFEQVVDLADGEHLPGVATALLAAELAPAGRQRLQGRLDARLRDEFSTLVLP